MALTIKQNSFFTCRSLNLSEEGNNIHQQSQERDQLLIAIQTEASGMLHTSQRQVPTHNHRIHLVYREEWASLYAFSYQSQDMVWGRIGHR